MRTFKQSLTNFENDVAILRDRVEKAGDGKNSDFRDAVFFRFGLAVARAVKVTRDFLVEEECCVLLDEGNLSVMQEAFSNALIDDANGWGELLQDRMTSAKMLEDAEAEEIFERIKTTHLPLLEQLLKTLQSKIS